MPPTTHVMQEIELLDIETNTKKQIFEEKQIVLMHRMELERHRSLQIDNACTRNDDNAKKTPKNGQHGRQTTSNVRNRVRCKWKSMR